jgi:hypothetical protein
MLMMRLMLLLLMMMMPGTNWFFRRAVKPHRTRPETDNLNSSTFPGIG